MHACAYVHSIVIGFELSGSPMSAKKVSMVYTHFVCMCVCVVVVVVVVVVVQVYDCMRVYVCMCVHVPLGFFQLLQCSWWYRSVVFIRQSYSSSLTLDV